jgi:PKD repeat protein
MLTSVLNRLRRHYATRSRGQSLVEFALILPVFMVLFATTLDLGRLAVAQLSVANAAREGAFQASKTPGDFSPTACPTSGTANLVTCRVQLELRDSGISVAPSDISVACSNGTCAKGMGNRVTVAVTGHFQLLTPLLTPFFGGDQDVAFTRSSTVQIETLPVPPTAPPVTTTTTTTSSTTSTSTTTSTTTTSTTTSTTSTSVNCSLPSAGFTYEVSPKSHQPPVTVEVKDTTTSPACAITSWLWTWGDNTTTLGQDPGAHTYLAKGSYEITLTVSNAAGTKTSGAVVVEVK